MQNENTHSAHAQTRRHFLQAAGTGAAALLAADRCLGQVPGSADKAQPPAKTPGDTPLRLGLASYSLRKFPLEKALAMTQRVGLKHICLKSFHLPLESKPEAVAAAAEKVKAAGLDLYGCGVITMKNKAEVDQAFDYAQAAGMKVIVGSPLPEVLPLVSDKVRQTGIAVAIHNHGPGDQTYPTPESVYEKIKDLDKRIGLCIDVGHTLRIGADPIRDAERFAARLLDVHIKDVTAAQPGAKEIVVGRGVIDIPRLLETLMKTKYAGVVAFEYENEPDDPLPGLAESVGYVRGALAALKAKPTS